MRLSKVVTTFALIGLMAAPALAQDGRRRRGQDQRGKQSQGQNQDQGERRRGDRSASGRAVPREAVRPSEGQRSADAPRASEAPRSGDIRRQDQNDRRRNDQSRGVYQDRRYDDRGDRYRSYDNRGQSRGRAYYPYYSNRGYGARTIIVPRFVRPSIVTVVPYRPYRYRPSIGIGIFYGSGGSYPYGYTPRGYYDPIPGRPYGGLRITGASRDAQVFADGYYVGIVNDFDGIFQHVNLEAGPHRIEIVEPGYEGIEFDVMIQPGRTTTFRADGYNY